MDLWKWHCVSGGPPVLAPRFDHSCRAKAFLQSSGDFCQIYEKDCTTPRLRGALHALRSVAIGRMFYFHGLHVDPIQFKLSLSYTNIGQEAFFQSTFEIWCPTQEEFGSRSEFEERATPYHFANALAILKASDKREAAAELFQDWQVRLKFQTKATPVGCTLALRAKQPIETFLHQASQ